MMKKMTTLCASLLLALGCLTANAMDSQTLVNNPSRYRVIRPDIGMFASFDPVALDQACADACLKATPIENSQLGEHLAEPGWHCHHDHFKDSNPNIEWEATLDQAEKIGLGTRQYELKRIK